MNWWAMTLSLTGLGWYVAACIILGVLGGLGLDKLAGTSPVFTVVGIVLGPICAFWGVYKLAQPLLDWARRQDPSKRGSKR